MQKERLDILLLKKGLASTRKLAQSYILSGYVRVNNEIKTKAGEKIPVLDSNIELIKKENSYVSIGGLKLEKLIKTANISFKDKNVLDIGSSTGGFTDFALKHGAHTVTAIDVGYGIIDWSLRSNPKVILKEKCNFRYYEPAQKEKYDIIVIDVSFISIKLMIENIIKCMHQESIFIPLIKPQFEAGPNEVSKKGILKNSDMHKKILFDLIDFFIYNKLYLNDITFTALKKHKGNIEYIGYFTKRIDDKIKVDDLINNIVNIAFKEVQYK